MFGTTVVQAYASVNWVLTSEPLDVETELALGFLDYLMMGTPAAPLRKAMNDSGLGAAIVGGGIDDELKQPVFSLGLKVSPHALDCHASFCCRSEVSFVCLHCGSVQQNCC